MHWPSLLQLDARKLPVKRAAKLLPHASVGLRETSVRLPRPKIVISFVSARRVLALRRACLALLQKRVCQRKRKL